MMLVTHTDLDSAMPVMQLVMTVPLSGFGTYISQITIEIPCHL